MADKDHLILTAIGPEQVEFFLPYKLTATCMDHPGIVKIKG